MSRKPMFNMDSFIEGKGDTENTQKVHKENTIGPLEIHHIRINKNVWDKMKIHFESKGIKVSQGIRLIIKEYIEKEGL